LTIESENCTLRTALLRSCLRYLLPNHNIKSKQLNTVLFFLSVIFSERFGSCIRPPA
jgi:hypothetical protein